MRVTNAAAGVAEIMFLAAFVSELGWGGRGFVAELACRMWPLLRFVRSWGSLRLHCVALRTNGVVWVALSTNGLIH